MGHDARGRGLRSPCADVDIEQEEPSLIQQAATSVLNIVGLATPEPNLPTAAELFERHQRFVHEREPIVEWREPESTLPTIDVTLRVNGIDRFLQIEPRVTLLDALRERLNLTGTKKGCNHGQCGACTVLVDGAPHNSCLSLACLYDGQEITTIEGLSIDEELHPLQAAFITHDAFQCGYCTPGQICSAVALLAGGHARTDDEIRERMSGNLCRCGAYNGIHAAIREVRDKKQSSIVGQPDEASTVVAA